MVRTKLASLKHELWQIVCIFSKDIFPWRVAGIHFINTPKIFWPIYKLLIKFLPRKIQGRVYLHNNVESLSKIIPLQLLPQAIGGSSLDEEAWDTNVIQNLLQKDICYDSNWFFFLKL